MGQTGPRLAGKNGKNVQNSTGEWKLIYQAKADVQQEAIKTLGLRLDMPGMLIKTRENQSPFKNFPMF